MDSQNFYRFGVTDFVDITKKVISKFPNGLYPDKGQFNVLMPNENNPDYAKYPHKITDKYGTCAISECEVFVRRYFNKWLDRNVRFNVFVFSKYDDKAFENSVCRQNYLMWVKYIKFCTGGYDHYVEFCGFDINLKSVSLRYKISELKDLVVRPCSNDEIRFFWDMVQLTPDTIYEIMEILPEYQQDYKLYLADCKKYGFKPMAKGFVSRIRIDEDTKTYLNKDAILWGRPTTDTKVVNKKNGN